MPLQLRFPGHENWPRLSIARSVGNLHIPGYPQPWEDPSFAYPATLASPLQILIDASNGASGGLAATALVTMPLVAWMSDESNIALTDSLRPHAGACG